MTVKIACGCGRIFELPATMEGKSFRCKACGEKVHVPLREQLKELPEIETFDGPVAVTATDALDKQPTRRHLSVTSNPDMFRFSLWRFIKCHPLSVYLPFMIFLGFSMAISLAHLPWMVGVFLGFIIAAVLFSEGAAKSARRHLHNGTLCAAVVTSTHPYQVAVLTNLSRDGSAKKLAIGVSRQRLGNMSGGAPRLGDRLVVTVIHTGLIIDGAWENFEAFAVNCACDDLLQIEQAGLKIHAADWTQLEETLAARQLKTGELVKLW